MIPPQSRHQETDALKEKVWDLKTLPKIKMFLWRALSGALAVSECLRNHGINTSSLCSVCHREPETICHVLFQCEAAKQVWERCNISGQNQVFSGSLQDNVSHVLQLMEGSALPTNLQAAIPWLLWGIWKHRNELVYAAKLGDLEILVSHAVSESEIWNNLMSARLSTNIQRSPTPRITNRWTRPPQGVLKGNIHASWANEFHMCGGAWIIRNHQGDVLFHAREAFLPAHNRIAAELRCIIWTLQGLIDIHVVNVELWSDCAAAIEAIMDPSNWPRYQTFLVRIHRLMFRFQKISFHISATKANKIAREIATSVTRDGRFQSYLARGPAWLHNLIEEDNRRISF